MRKKLILSTITALIISGCSGGSSSDPVASSSDDGVLTGEFIDSPVANVEYETDSGISGKTDINGSFRYREGDKVKFHIGKLVLGEAEPKVGEPVTPADLTDNNETLTLTLRFLQALDQDGNVSNGIHIPEDVVHSLEEHESEVHIEELDDEEILELDESIERHVDEDHDGEIDVDEENATNHFHSSMDKIKHKDKKDEDRADSENRDSNSSVVDVKSYNLYQLTPELKDAIAYMGNEERLAYDVYKHLYEFHKENNQDEIKQFINIADRSEVRHIATVRELVNKYELKAEDVTVLDGEVTGDGETPIDEVRGEYGVEKIQNLYNNLVELGEASREDALKVGCMVEVTDVIDLNEYIAQAEEAQAQDVIDAFKALRDGSYNHYWAFDKGLKNLGVEDGCCSIGEVDGVNYCHPEFPQNEREHNGTEEEHQNEDHSGVEGEENHNEDMENEEHGKKENHGEDRGEKK